MAKIEVGTLTKGGVEILSKKGFSEKYADNVSVAALDAAIEADKIDYIQPGREQLIVVNEKTLTYRPNFSPART